MTSHDERQTLYNQLRPSSSRLAYKLTAHLKALIKSSDHPGYIKRALRATDIVLSFLDLSYRDYRTFVGNLNHIRRSGVQPGWGELITMSSSLKEQVSDTTGIELAGLLRELAIAEAERSTHESASSDEKRPAQLRLIEDLLLMSRTLYPLGLNVIQPEWEWTGPNESYFTLEHDSFIQLSSNTSVMISRDREDQNCARIETTYHLERTDDKSSKRIDTIKLSPSSAICIGRGHLRSRSLFGFPISFRVDSDLKIDDSLCSRAALLCILDENGHLFILDRASRNRVTCVAQSRRDPSHSLVYYYMPEVTSSRLNAPSSSAASASSAEGEAIAYDELEVDQSYLDDSDSPASKSHTLVYNFGTVRREEVTLTRSSIDGLQPEGSEAEGNEPEDTELSREPVSPPLGDLDFD